MQEQPSRQGPPHEGRQGEIWRGVGLALLLHLIQIPLAAVTSFVSLVFIGVSQLLYIIPAIVFYYRQGRRSLVNGLIIVAALTFMLNATCAAIFFAALISAH